MISVKGNKDSVKKLGGYLLPVLLTLLFLYFAFRGINLSQSFELIGQTSILWLIVYVIIFLLSHFIRAVRWNVMIKPVKKDASLLNLFGAVMIGYGVNCIIPRMGEIYRGLFLGRWEKISRSTMIGTVVVERIIDVASFALASFLSVYVYSGDLFNEIPWLKFSLMMGFGIIIVITLLLVLFVKFEEKFTSVMLKISGKINPKLSEKISYFSSSLVEGISSVQGSKNVLRIFFLTLTIFFFYALNTYVGFVMLDMESLGPVDWKLAWVFMTISAFGVMIPTPGGTGSYHILSIFVLSQLYPFSYEVSAAYALLTHFISYVVFISSTVILIYVINKKRGIEGESKENFFSVFNIKQDEK